MNVQQLYGGIFGVCVGDALGVPVEFCAREQLRERPVTGMRGYGSHGQPAGTWSDDSSMTLCLAETLSEGYDCGRLAWRFVKWADEGYLAPRGEVFDIGNGTHSAIERFKAGVPACQCGGTGEWSNGNGSLMRILPLAFYLYRHPRQKWQKIAEVSSVTHAHPVSVLACMAYVETAVGLLDGKTLARSWRESRETVCGLFREGPKGWAEAAAWYETTLFGPRGDYAGVPETAIKSSGYVADTLDAAMWCLFQGGGYRECVLRAVNLGDDSDTVAAVTGGLAGILHGYEGIPPEWRGALQGRETVERVCEGFSRSLGLEGPLM